MSESSIHRRSHPKSRNGCRICKRRKIKCDERRPFCLNCSKHRVDCEYPERFNDFAAPIEIGASNDGEVNDPNALNLRDLELLHNFTASTCTTLSLQPVLRDFYRITVPRLGFKCEYLMRTILALSALHLAYNRPAQKEHYQAQALSYHKVASREATGLISSATASNAENLLLFSILTMFFALACPRHDDDFLLVGESGFPNWPFLLNGTRALIAVIDEDRRTTGPLAPLLILGRERTMAAQAATDSHSAPSVLVQLEKFIRARKLPESEVQICATAIAELRECFSALSPEGKGPRTDITELFAWIWRVAEDFMPLLKIPTKEAVTIFAYWCVLIKYIDNHWWAWGWAEHLIAKAYYMLDEVYRLWIQWPMEEIGWSPP